MPQKHPTPVEETFLAALDQLIAQAKEDKSILAAILCGSLSHDTVWAKSDIDLTFITIDDKKIEETALALRAHNVNIHAFLLPRAEFRKIVEGAIRNSFMHSLLAKGRLLYTHDPTIADLCDKLHEIGERDRRVQLLATATYALTHPWSNRDVNIRTLSAAPADESKVLAALNHPHFARQSTESKIRRS